MMHAVIRTPTDSTHLIGHLDAYNMESLRDYVRRRSDRGGVSLVISIDPADRPALDAHAGWLGRLGRSGVTVLVCSGPRGARSRPSSVLAR
jgi:hypothetical protein